MSVSNSAAQKAPADQKSIAGNLNQLPLSFESNQEQLSSDARFLAVGRGFSAQFKEHETDLLLSAQAQATDLVRISMQNSSRDVTVTAESRLPGTVNYIIGNDSNKWRTALPTFERLRYADVYHGVDLIYYGSQDRLEFDFQVSPGADPNCIQMRFDGIQSMKMDHDGNLVLTAAAGQIKFQTPVIYQLAKNGVKEYVEGSFALLANNTVGFSIADYDRAKPLIIDPILNYSTYIGANANATGIAVDQNGEAYLVGTTTSIFPTTSGSLHPGPVTLSASQSRVFVSKFNSTGTALLYSTYLSGSVAEQGNGIALDSNGDALVVGCTWSSDFPITTGAFQTKNYTSQYTGFVAELNSTGTALIYSTYLGGSTQSCVNHVALDATGNAYLTGYTLDTDFPVSPRAFMTTAPAKGATNTITAFVSKLNPTGTALVYSTYLGGEWYDYATSITADSAGEAYVGGTTSSNNFPVTQGALQATREGSNRQAGFVTKLNASGSALVYSTFLNGNFIDSVNAITVDRSGNAYATGSTESSDFPVTAGAFQSTIGISGFGYSQTNAFLSELNSTGSSLLYSTFLGGGISQGALADEGDEAYGIALDEQGMAYLDGTACTIDFPITVGALEPQNLAGELGAQCTSFLTKMNPSPNTPLLYSTFFGGTGNTDPDDYANAEVANALALDPSGNAYLTGYTESIDFPVTYGVYETPFNGASQEVFVAEFNASEMKSLPIPTVTLTSNQSPVLYGQSVTFTATVQPASGSNPPTGYLGFDFYSYRQMSDIDGTGVGFGPWTTVALDGTGVATFTTSSLNDSQTQVNAIYLGDANNAPASGTMTQSVTYIQTKTAVTESVNNVPYGTEVTFTFTVTDQFSNPASGVVMYSFGSQAGFVTLDSNGQGTWSESTLPVGTNTIAAKFLQPVGYASSSGTVNLIITALGNTPTPTFAPPAGTYTSAQQVTFEDSNSAATVYFTTDGSTPLVGTSNSLPVGFVVSVNNTETLNAVAVAPGYNPSDMASALYTVNLPAPDFSISLFPQTMSLNAGDSGNTTVSVGGMNGFVQSVSFACSGLPTGVTCAFSPTQVTGTGETVMTITTSSSAAFHTNSRPVFPESALAVVLFCMHICLLIATGAAGLSLLSGCGSGGSSYVPPTTPQSVTSVISVTASAGSLSHSTNFFLTVQ
jgi:hypothetical protein